MRKPRSLKMKRMMKKRRFNRFAKRVYRVIHPEFKLWADNVTGSAGIYDSGVFSKMINIISLGTDQGKRIGNKINIKSIKLRIRIDFNTASENDYAQYRILVVKDKFPDNNGISDINKILDFDNSGSTHMNAFRNLAYFKNYKVLKDTYCKTVGIVGGLVPTHTWNWYLKVNSVTTYTASQELASDISINGYVVYVFADQGGNYPNVSLDYSVRYIDS